MTAPCVLQVVGSLAVGGAERVALELAAGLAARGWRSALGVVGTGDAPCPAEPLAAEAERRGVPVHRLAFAGLRAGIERARLLRFLHQGWDLVHVHNRPCDWQLALWGRRAGVPVLYTRHLVYADQSRRQRALYFAAARVAPAVVAVTDAVAEHLRAAERTPRRRIHAIPDGIDVAHYRPPTPAGRARARAALGLAARDFVWLCAARLVLQKGHPDLLRALGRLPATSRARLLLAGDGPEAESLGRLARRLGLGPRVRFLGVREDVRELLWACDGYVCASLAEGQGLSLLEAWATGRPVVAPRLACVEEIAPREGVRFFGPRHRSWAPGHDPEALAAALGSLERTDAGDLAAARRHVVARYSVGRMLTQHERLYARVLARRRPRVQAAHRASSISK